MSKATDSTLIDALLVVNLGDWVAELSAMYEARRILENEERGVIVPALMGAIDAMVTRGLVRVGRLEADGFHAWLASDNSHLDSIRRAWVSLERDPFPGEFFWMELTEAGRRRAESLWKPSSGAP